MKNNLTDILGDALPQELVQSLQEAFDQKIAESRSEIEAELVRRYDFDRNNLIEGIDRMVTDAVTKIEESRAEEIAKLTEARVQFHSAMVEGRKAAAVRVAEGLDRAKDIIGSQLTKEILALREQKEAAVTKTLALAEELKSAKRHIAEQHSRHLDKINSFVTAQVRKELVEFAEDKRALVESRVKLVSESRSKLKDTQQRFVAEAAKKVDSLVNETLKLELAQLHEDLERNRQNMFGRRIFEAVAAEFMTSYLAEGTEIRKLQKVLESKDEALASKEADYAAAQARIDEALAAKDASARKAILAEDRADRTKIMSELLTNLAGDKRSVMENLLESTKTGELRKAFDKLLPVVLAEGRRKNASSPALLSEKRAEPKISSRSVTGNAVKSNRLLESQEEETQDLAEIAIIRRYAGISE